MSTERWLVTFTDRSTQVVEINATGNPFRNEHAAMYLAEKTTSKLAFCAKPEGCTGFSYNLHFGAEEACPIHKDIR